MFDAAQPTASDAEFIDRVTRESSSILPVLSDLVAIASVSSLPERHGDVRASADLVAELCRGVGCPDVQIVSAGGQPAVIARFPAPPGQPTVCLYAHHDVQPVGEEAQWSSAPFQASERDGRLYGRGAADDKAGLAMHLAVLKAFDGRPPVGVTLFIEGEEEIGSPTLSALLRDHAEELAADVYVIADGINWQVGSPGLTTSLRGIADCVVEVRTLDHGLHSGEYGGVVPDALSALVRLLATLHDDQGNVAIDGLGRGTAPAGIDYPESRLDSETGKLDGVAFIGHGSAAERLWQAPACTVIGIDAPSVASASNTLVPVASAKVSLRVAPGDDAEAALAALVAHLQDHAPWGAQVQVTPGEVGQPGLIPLQGRVAELVTSSYTQAFGVAPVEIGCGGSIPMVHEFQQAFPGAAVLVTAVADPQSRIHSTDESLHLGDFTRQCVAEALLVRGLGVQGR